MKFKFAIKRILRIIIPPIHVDVNEDCKTAIFYRTQTMVIHYLRMEIRLRV